MSGPGLNEQFTPHQLRTHVTARNGHDSDYLNLVEPVLAGVMVVVLGAFYMVLRHRNVMRASGSGLSAASLDNAGELEGAGQRGYIDVLDTLFCPICGTEYIAGTAACEDCGVDLVDEWDVPEADSPIEQGVVRICRVHDVLLGHLVGQYLLANRIPYTLSRFVGADIYVLESDAVRAKRLIQHYVNERCTTYA